MRSFSTAIRYTLVTAVFLGLAYPLFITAVAQLTMRYDADGQLVIRNGQVIGSSIIGQNFTAPGYFHGRPSAAGSGYDAANSGGSNLAQSNAALEQRFGLAVAQYQKQNPGRPVPIELVTTSASGLDPEISPAAALYQVHSVAAARHLSEDAVRVLVEQDVQGRTFGVLGEPRINVLRLNLDLDRLAGR
jgi:K+-transporting ATPase ATPase C chain